MDLGVETATALVELRRQAESRMVDSCTVHRVLEGETVTDPVTGVDSPATEQVYAGRCRVQTYEPQERNPELGGATATVQRYAAHVPVGSFEPQVGHVVTITAAALDPHLVGRVFRVVALLHKTAATAYRLGVEEVST